MPLGQICLYWYFKILLTILFGTSFLSRFKKIIIWRLQYYQKELQEQPIFRGGS